MNRAIPLKGPKNRSRETPITKSIMRDLKQRPGVFVHKNHGGRFGNSGLPDLLISFIPVRTKDAKQWDGPAIVIGMEVKRPGENPTPLQQKTLDRMARCGMFATVARSKREAIEYLETLSIPAKVQQEKES